LSQYKIFLDLHHAAQPLLLGNIWDAGSARLLEENGFKAIATSSAAVANSLGYEDGQQMPFELLFETVQRIIKTITVPLSVDLEKGFANSISEIIRNVERLHDIGVVGINIEDSAPGDGKGLVGINVFEKTLSAIAGHLSARNLHIYINARTDAFLVGMANPLEETIQRVKAYTAAGAGGIFVPFVLEETDINEIIHATSLPVNVLSVPGLPDIAKLASIGVKRISLGSSLYRCVNREMVTKIRLVQERQSVSPLF
jgi:2-methylisocitrate lyase-like PEP mutase family enzyme